MIDIKKSINVFNKFLDRYKNKDVLGFNIKVVHTFNVVKLASRISSSLNLSKEDIELAQLIALLHDIGRFEELNRLSRFDTKNFDHAKCGVLMLFEEGLIREFIGDDSYDEIIKIAIYNHSKLYIEEGLSDKYLLHVNIIRDADKIDNFRVIKEERIENILPNLFKGEEDFINSKISDKVYKTVLDRKCVDIKDKKYPLDHLIYALAYIFGLNFRESFIIIKENDYINCLIDSYSYSDLETKMKMEEIRNIMNDYVDNKIGNVKSS